MMTVHITVNIDNIAPHNFIHDNTELHVICFSHDDSTHYYVNIDNRATHHSIHDNTELHVISFSHDDSTQYVNNIGADQSYDERGS